ncbi:MAG: tRNA (adenosine(37)-N6)-dimethylallyltransferase MiaA [Planctomycetes bacterium]|nr:tRNA (adenosine(37)-N6)-dimethylallyltransferase MiaA [Planctomycetota bacterium]
MAETAKIYVLAGVTAVGKTATALAWAERGGAEILSCDSLLFYRGMDLGTAKPTQDERTRIPHHGLDLVSVNQPYDVGAYLAYAERVVREISERGKRVLVVGGSGFYLQTFFSPVIDEVTVSAELREQVRTWEEEEGADGLLERLRKLNPGGLGDLAVGNPRRVVRALERCMASGKDLLALQMSFRQKDFPFREHRKVAWMLDRKSEDLEERVRRRTSAMLANGLLDEVQLLREAGLEKNPSASRAVGYRETLLFLNGELSKEEWEEGIVTATMRLARKQRKWFRSRLPTDRVILLSADESLEGLPAPWQAEACGERA